tara:strand:- start:936 stop:1859 length:924 start_codon:yes stop_codon:yes gene_type:complete
MVKKENSVVGVRLLDLFSGIGGFSLAASWVWGDELDIVGFCEIDKYCHKVLNKNFPGVPIYKDITTLDGNQFKNIDIITGGFPCQDISIAGRGKSLINEETGETTRSGLWFEMLRVISEVRPRYALIENVPMLTVRGGVRVIADLTEIGYDASWTIVSAADVGAWHNRKRIWIVAHSQEISDSERKSSYNFTDSRSNTKIIKSQRQKQRTRSIDGISCKENVSDSNKKRSQRMEQEPQKIRRSDKQTGFQSRARSGSWWHTEPELGRVANGIPNRVDRLKGLGNAIVPQCAYEIFKYIARKNAKTFN